MANTIWCTCCITLLLCVSTITGDQKSILVKEKEILDNILNTTSYDYRVRPMERSDVLSPTKISVSMYILMISRIDDVRMQYNAQLFLRQKWLDNRLKFDDLGGKLKNLNLFEEKIWTPDLFVANEISGYVNSVLKPNKFVRIHPDGSVLYSTRVSLVLSCPMNFRFFPFDTQTCSIEVESYGFSTADVIYGWYGDHAVGMNNIIELPFYTIQKYNTNVNHVVLSTGNYSRLRFDFLLKRNLNYHMGHLFIPSMLLVVTSWIAFWLDHQIVMTRLFVVLTTLLVVSYKFSEFNASLTPVSYTKSVDIWTGTCLAFIFAALIEVVVVDYRWRQQQKKQLRAAGALETTDEENIDMRPLVTNSSCNTTHTSARAPQGGRLSSYYYRLVPNLPTGPKRMDVLSRYLFPICFTSFNIFYWFINLVYYAF